MKASVVFFLAAICFAAPSAYAQQQPQGAERGAQGAAQQGRGGQSTTREDALDPTPVNPSVDPNIDMFINDYKNAKPHAMYGHLVFRDILTKLQGPNPTHPTVKGAVLTAITAISYATLAPGAAASGRVHQGDLQIFYTTAGEGKITVNSKSYDLKEGVGFTLTPNFDFKLTSTGKDPLAFYVRAQPLPDNFEVSPGLVVVNRFDNDRRIGAHWVHTCDGGPRGMDLCTVPPFTMPQPHSHPGEEAWIMVKGDSILSLGKNLRLMVPGQAYKIPPTGITAHSNINLSDRPVELIYMGPLERGPQGAGGPLGGRDYARLDNSRINPAADPAPDMFTGNWQDSYPRVMYGNLYIRDMLTALQGPDSLHPTRKGAVLTHAVAVSYAMLEPGSTAHPVKGDLEGIQQCFVVDSGTGVIKSGSSTFQLSKGKAFIITPGLDFRMTATGNDYMTFYVVSEELPEGFTPKATLDVVDNTAKPQVTRAWWDKDRALIAKADGLSQYEAVNQVEQPPMTMSQPYSDSTGVEEIWIATKGDVDLLMGKQLIKLHAGMAYRVPSTGITAHANINASSTPAEFLYMVTGKTLSPIAGGN